MSIQNLFRLDFLAYVPKVNFLSENSIKKKKICSNWIDRKFSNSVPEKNEYWIFGQKLDFWHSVQWEAKKNWEDFWLDFFLLIFPFSNPPYFHVTFRSIVTFSCFMPAKKDGKIMAFFHDSGKKVRFSIFVTNYANTTVCKNIF